MVARKYLFQDPLPPRTPAYMVIASAILHGVKNEKSTIQNSLVIHFSDPDYDLYPGVIACLRQQVDKRQRSFDIAGQQLLAALSFNALRKSCLYLREKLVPTSGIEPLASPLPRAFDTLISLRILNSPCLFHRNHPAFLVFARLLHKRNYRGCRCLTLKTSGK